MTSGRARPGRGEESIEMRAIGGEDRIGFGIGRDIGQRPALEPHADRLQLRGDAIRILGDQKLRVLVSVPNGQAAHCPSLLSSISQASMKSRASMRIRAPGMSAAHT